MEFTEARQVPYFRTWKHAQPIIPKDNIRSSYWGGKGKKAVFYPTYLYEGKPNMYKIVTFEYARIWQEERLDWEKHAERSDGKLQKALQWKDKFQKQRIEDVKRRSELKAKAVAESRKKKEQKELEEKMRLEAKAAELRKRKEAESAEKERKKLELEAAKKRAEAISYKRENKKKQGKKSKISPVNNNKESEAHEIEKPAVEIENCCEPECLVMTKTREPDKCNCDGSC